MITDGHTSFQPLVPSLVLLNMLLNASSEHTVALFQPNGGRLDDICLRDLSRFVVRDRNDRTVCNSRVGEYVGFKLCRGNL